MKAAPQQEAADPPGTRPVVRCVLQNGPRGGNGVGAMEQNLSGGGFIEQYAEREDIALGRTWRSFYLFRRQIGDGSGQRAFESGALGTVPLIQMRQTEIQDLGTAGVSMTFSGFRSRCLTPA